MIPIVTADDIAHVSKPRASGDDPGGGYGATFGYA